MYHSEKPEDMVVTHLEKSPIQKGKYPVPEDTWYIDGSTRGTPSRGQLSYTIPQLKRCGLKRRMEWMVITQEPGENTLNICTGSWAVCWGLTLWVAQWATQDWTVHLSGQRYVGWYMERGRFFLGWDHMPVGLLLVMGGGESIFLLCYMLLLCSGCIPLESTAIAFFCHTRMNDCD